MIGQSSSTDDIKAYFPPLSTNLEIPKTNRKSATYKETNTDVDVGLLFCVLFCFFKRTKLRKGHPRYCCADEIFFFLSLFLFVLSKTVGAASLPLLKPIALYVFKCH